MIESIEEEAYQIDEHSAHRYRIDTKQIACVELVDIGSDSSPVTLVAYHSKHTKHNRGRTVPAMSQSLAGMQEDWEVPFYFAGNAGGKDAFRELIETSCSERRSWQDIEKNENGVPRGIDDFAFYVAVRAQHQEVAEALKLKPRFPDKRKPRPLMKLVKKLRNEIGGTGVRKSVDSVNSRFYRDLAMLLIHEQNVVLEGVPGTGKSFAVENLRGLWADASEQATGERRELADDPRVVVLHPSSSYEDLIEGIRLRVPDDQNFDRSAREGATPENGSSKAADGNGGS